MYTLDTTVSAARRDLLVSRLRETNTRRSPVLAAMRDTPLDADVPVHVHALDPGDGDALVGGLVGHVWGRWLHVDYLWVDEHRRGAGLGGRLLARAEETARREHDCLFARVGTWDFQAPGFYQLHGYTIALALPDYPPGVTDYLLTKPLT
ncbi:N-acetyltransferase [Streptomyces sp. JJ38]|uniref:GNAT family N-acetyltransferase n=1 Tax=Streptomyces sp. JJ38 TaxID=2738128 RepID=UPI001C5A2885|nr:GNAT family N-acetyltransferase [Streptomyces sp. JJ38]MBW1595814.1 GNAT family N-acetyltransferase [Streptomyces sp. JJ38]